MIRSRILRIASLLGLASLLSGCDGLDSSNDNLPPPAIFHATAVDACGTAGSTAITLALTSARVREGVPQPPAATVDRIEVDGVVTGLAAGDQVFGLVVDDTLDCPLLATGTVTPAADGSFRLVIGVADLVAFRVVAVTAPAGATAACADASDCVQFDNAGTVVSVTGISNAIGVRL